MLDRVGFLIPQGYFLVNRGGFLHAGRLQLRLQYFQVTRNIGQGGGVGFPDRAVILYAFADFFRYFHAQFAVFVQLAFVFRDFAVNSFYGGFAGSFFQALAGVGYLRFQLSDNTGRCSSYGRGGGLCATATGSGCFSCVRILAGQGVHVHTAAGGLHVYRYFGFLATQAQYLLQPLPRLLSFVYQPLESLNQTAHYSVGQGLNNAPYLVTDITEVFAIVVGGHQGCHQPADSGNNYADRVSGQYQV